MNSTVNNQPSPDLETGIQYFTKSDYVTAVDVFSRAIIEVEQVVGREKAQLIDKIRETVNKSIDRVNVFTMTRSVQDILDCKVDLHIDSHLYDILEYLSESAERAELYPIALSSATRMTEIYPSKAEGYKRRINILTKLNRLSEANDLQLEAIKLCDDFPADSFTVKSPRRDPCQIFPTEILRGILSYLDIQDRTSLQCVSKLWYEKLTDPYLWASSIDLSLYPTCKALKLKQCLHHVFLDKPTLSRSPVGNIKYLHLSQFSSPDEEIKGLETLERYNFAWLGKISELVLTNINEPDPYLYQLTSVKNLQVDTKKSIILNKLLRSQRDLETLFVACGKMNISDEDELNSIEDDLGNPSLKEVFLTYDLSQEPLQHLISVCHELKTLSIQDLESAREEPFQFNLDFLYNTKISQIEKLNISFSEKTPIVRNTDVATSSSEIKWPATLEKLRFHKATLSTLNILPGALTSLTSLDLGECELDLIPFLNHFQAGQSLKHLNLKKFCGSEFNVLEILSVCINLQVLILYECQATFTLESAKISKVLTKRESKNRLKQIDIGKAACNEEDVKNLAECGLKLIGCEGIQLTIACCDILSKSGTQVSFKELDI